MLKAYADQRNRCYLHPHRVAETKCERCKTGLCAECVREFRGQHLCESCVNELKLFEASKPTLRERVSDSLRSLRNTLIVVGVVIALAGGAFYLLRGTLNQPITPEEFARFRYAAAGSFQTPEGINVNSTVLGASVVSYSSQRPGFEVTHLINEYVGEGYPGWRSAQAALPQVVVVEGQQTSSVSKVILTQQPNEPTATRVKDFAVAVSTVGPDTGFTTVGQFEAQSTDGPQRFLFSAAPTRWIRLTILSNYGSPDYTSLGEFDAFVVPPGTNPIPQTPTP